MPGPDGEVPVVGVAAAGAAQGEPAATTRPATTCSASSASAPPGRARMREFGFQRLGSEIVLRLQMRIY